MGSVVWWLLALVGTAWGLVTSPSDILANPGHFDQKIVTITGKVTNPLETVSRKGNPYYTYDLHDGRMSIVVFGFGNAPCPNGANATVDGLFRKVKRVSGRTFYRQVNAMTTRCR